MTEQTRPTIPITEHPRTFTIRDYQFDLTLRLPTAYPPDWIERIAKDVQTTCDLIPDQIYAHYKEGETNELFFAHLDRIMLRTELSLLRAVELKMLEQDADRRLSAALGIPVTELTIHDALIGKRK